MRDVGYSLETAIADLIDNSITARASQIDIVCNATDSRPFVAIIDNGSGMTREGLLEAMRHGSVSPRENRDPGDLGRFGLGLKTASFSQCRSLTVVTKCDDVIAGAEWNLDRIDTENDWILIVLSREDIETLPCVDELSTSGTVVVWRELDRLMEGERNERQDELINEKLAIVRRHLALVFHRFLSGGVKGYQKLSITLNGDPIAPFDPFCLANDATQILPEEIVRIGGAEVRLQPYILPHHSRLSVAEYDQYRNHSDFISNQGAYVYRNGRLLAWGDWFRLVAKGEATKLARVQVNFPNSLDEAWTIDIKKSRASPPPAVRERMRQIIDKVSQRSVRVHKGRGERRLARMQDPLWHRLVERGGVRFVINREHPLIHSLRDSMAPQEFSLLGVLLDAITASLPVEMIYSDYSTDPQKVEQKEMADDTIMEQLAQLHGVLLDGNVEAVDEFRQVVRASHLFDGREELVEHFIEENFA